MDLEKEIKNIIEEILLENLKQFRYEMINDIIKSKFESFRAMKKLYEDGKNEGPTFGFIIEGLKVEIETLASNNNNETMFIHFNEKYKNWELIPDWYKHE